MSSSGLKQELIARLMELGQEDDDDIWGGAETEPDVWAPGHDIPDQELEGQRVNVKGFGNGRVVEVGRPTWGSGGTKHKIALDSGDIVKMALASKDNNGRGTEFMYRRDQTTIDQNRRYAQARKILTPDLLHALTGRGMELERALESADEDAEGTLLSLIHI